MFEERKSQKILIYEKSDVVERHFRFIIGFCMTSIFVKINILVCGRLFHAGSQIVFLIIELGNLILEFGNGNN